MLFFIHLTVIHPRNTGIQVVCFSRVAEGQHKACKNQK